ncbi:MULTISPECIES: nuclear transport factor 2 family protein [unclassified Halomonas]|uniref:nuclear transport factor 2 family protein n=1 Tax=unclassified Halomonas TaxID=2609666 RepID=UPI0021E43828|nr:MULTISPECIES: nuclear transport factor 2 family protein [unclassified Halomonas]UYF99290.1 nuclear transport factor 2 family protein [Halomonas sp. GD1P12]WNL39554.1 nuclear transport factor 2 family protein [Halomonas sp. PAMB 3232]WNL42911.1 nuclear transport factor 2 family protein [Halomonas sp. PAMB 3264]
MESNASERRGSDKTQVRAFLAAMQARDLAKAKRFLAERVALEFPGAPTMASLEEVIAWAGSRYRHVSKTLHGVDHCVTPLESIVICHGVLDVTWLDDTTSTGVRFIDRFELKDGLIIRQQVWNDLALVRPHLAPAGHSPL